MKLRDHIAQLSMVALGCLLFVISLIIPTLFILFILRLFGCSPFKRGLPLLFCLLAACAPFAGQTMKLQIGMTEAEVRKIMGAPITRAAQGQTVVDRYVVDTGLQTLPYWIAYANGRVIMFGHPGDFATEAAPVHININSNIYTGSVTNQINRSPK